MNIFEAATRNAYRFPSIKGGLTTEDLWSLPLTSKAGFDLDNVAKAVNEALQAASTTSFVSTEADPRKGILETQLEIVKHIIAVRLEESAATRDQAARKAEKARLLDILATKEDDVLLGLSAEEIRDKINALG